MDTLSVQREIRAPVAVVFDTISDVRSFADAVPDVVKVEILSEVDSGVGTRFRETRVIQGKQATTELEVTELVENDRIRIVGEANGAEWDSVFTVRPSADGATELTLTMEGRARTMAAKLMLPMIRGMIREALERDMDAVKAYCERGGSA